MTFRQSSRWAWVVWWMLSAASIATIRAETYSWSDKAGKAIEANFVKVEGDTVVIEKGGKSFTVPLSKLDEASVKLAQRLGSETPDSSADRVPPLPAENPDVGRGNEMVPIPAGTFTMGDTFESAYEAKPHDVKISAFLLASRETSKEDWDRVRTWAIGHGYGDLAEGAGIGPKHPVYQISWFDAVKWCNARSEMERLKPCYHLDPEHSAPFRTGTVSLSPDHVSWDSNGYRLPTEAEWERAARGGLDGKRFPTGDSISHDIANFQNRSGIPYQSGTLSFHPAYKTSTEPYTAPVGSFAPNAYGLHDMAGNLSEYCWDFFAVYDETPQVNPRGPQAMGTRVTRGGSWINDPPYCTVWRRTNIGPAIKRETYIGFRIARSKSS